MCESETETGSLFVIQCVKAPIPISMIISYSLWAKTATLIQFISPLLTGAEMLDPAEVTSEVFRGCRVVGFVLRLGRESCSYRVADLRGPAYIIVYLPDRILVFTEHLVASRIYMIPWAKVYQFQKYTCFFKRKKKLNCPVVSINLSQSFGIICSVYIPWLSFMCDIQRQVQSITVTFNSLELMTCHFYLALMSFLFVFIPDLSSLHSDIVNYFKLSGR